MTNEQTAVFLRRVQADLQRILDEISDSLPGDLERHASKDFLTRTTRYGRQIVLDPLGDYIDGLGEDIAILAGGGFSSTK